MERSRLKKESKKTLELTDQQTKKQENLPKVETIRLTTIGDAMVRAKLAEQFVHIVFINGAKN